jgi:hypothetical protein
VITPRSIACDVMVSFRCNTFKSVQHSLLYRHYSVNILYIVTLIILYPFSIRYVCKLDSWGTNTMTIQFWLKNWV